LIRLKQEVERKIKGENRYISKYPLTPLEVFKGDSLSNLQGSIKKLCKEYEDVAEFGAPVALEWKKKVWSRLSFDVVQDYLLLNKIAPENKKEISEAFEEHEKILKELGYLKMNVSKLRGPEATMKFQKRRTRLLKE